LVEDWSCLGNVQEPGPSAGSLKNGVVFIDFLTMGRLTGFDVKLCFAVDSTCSTPLEAYTDDAGFVAFSFMKFTTLLFPHLEVAGSDAGPSTYPPALLYPPRRAFTHTWLTGWLFLSRGVFENEFPTWDRNLGLVSIAAHDCNPFSNFSGAGGFGNTGNRAAGIQFVASPVGPSTIVAYVQNGAYSTTATATDTNGFGAIVNLTPGDVTLVARRQDNGQPIGTITVPVRADTITGVVLDPSP
jgi:hypothetical protein